MFAQLVLVKTQPEVVRRIIGKAILTVAGEDVQQVTGSLQLCGAQESGFKAAIHAMKRIFEDSHTDCTLLADASNAFNRLNRQVALHNIQSLCPSLAATIVNTDRCPARLQVDGDSVYSREGTTQGDPLPMLMYALGMMPLLQRAAEAGAKQAWYADD